MSTLRRSRQGSRNAEHRPPRATSWRTPIDVGGNAHGHGTASVSPAQGRSPAALDAHGRMMAMQGGGCRFAFRWRRRNGLLSLLVPGLVSLTLQHTLNRHVVCVRERCSVLLGFGSHSLNVCVVKQENHILCLVQQPGNTTCDHSPAEMHLSP
jgi:hypothetical protein